jgi:hypothetical protein
MSKSYGNTILLTDQESTVREKLRTMVNDPRRVYRTDPGNPDVCPVGDLHKIFSEPKTVQQVGYGCRAAAISCTDCKSWAADALIRLLGPMQERRKKYEENPRLAWDVLEDGSARARRVCEETMKEVRGAMGMSSDYSAGLFRPREDTPELLFIDQAVWNLSGNDFGDAMRDRWLASLPASVNLKDIGSRTFLTNSRKRVAIASSHERNPGEWTCEALDRHTEVLVLLLARKTLDLISIVLPQKVLQPNWKKFDRTARQDLGKKGDAVKLPVRERDSDFWLEFPDGQAVSVTEYRSNYSPLF